MQRAVSRPPAPASAYTPNLPGAVTWPRTVPLARVRLGAREIDISRAVSGLCSGSSLAVRKLAMRRGLRVEGGVGSSAEVMRNQKEVQLLGPASSESRAWP